MDRPGPFSGVGRSPLRTASTSKAPLLAADAGAIAHTEATELLRTGVLRPLGALSVASESVALVALAWLLFTKLVGCVFDSSCVQVGWPCTRVLICAGIFALYYLLCGFVCVWLLLGKQFEDLPTLVRFRDVIISVCFWWYVIVTLVYTNSEPCDGAAYNVLLWVFACHVLDVTVLQQYNYSEQEKTVIVDGITAQRRSLPCGSRF